MVIKHKNYSYGKEIDPHKVGDKVYYHQGNYGEISSIKPVVVPRQDDTTRYKINDKWVDHDNVKKNANEAIEEDMSDIHAAIHNSINKEDKTNIQIGAPSTHIHVGHPQTGGTKKYSVYPVNYHTKGTSKGPGYMTYVHHEEGSTNIKSGLPPRKGGEVRTVINK